MAPEQPKDKITIDDQALMLFEGNLKRIFAMKITRSTFRELQNVVFSIAGQNKDLATFFLDTLFSGQIRPNTANENQKKILDEIIKNFTIPARLSKEVFERGDFISMITSDVVGQGDDVALLNRVRRIDGEEYIFLSDIENSVNLISHFIGRLYETDKNETAKKQLQKFKKDLSILADRLKQLSL